MRFDPVPTSPDNLYAAAPLLVCLPILSPRRVERIRELLLLPPVVVVTLRNFSTTNSQYVRLALLLAGSGLTRQTECLY